MTTMRTPGTLSACVCLVFLWSCTTLHVSANPWSSDSASSSSSSNSVNPHGRFIAESAASAVSMKEALLQLRQDLSPPAVVDVQLADWTNATAPCGLPRWTGVGCSAGVSGDVLLPTSLDLHALQLTGQLPASIGGVTSLTYLNLTHNLFYGPLPNPLSRLAHLVSLDASSNVFVGSLPTTYFVAGGLTALTELRMGSNQLSGTLPESLSSATSLRVLDLRANRFTGTLPASWFTETGLTSLRELYLKNNGFFGTLPETLALLTALEVLDMDTNQFSGNIPAKWFTAGGLSSLWMISLYNNRLSGSLPEKLTLLTNLKNLQLFNNLLRGSMPSSWLTTDALTSLTFLRLDGNRLSGALPDRPVLLTGLQYLYLFGNFLAGPLPASFGAMTNLKLLSLGRNVFTGTPPPQWSTLTQLINLDLSGFTMVAGSLPQQWSTLSNLTYFNATGSEGLCGPIDLGAAGGAFGATPPECSIFLTNSMLNQSCPAPPPPPSGCWESCRTGFVANGSVCTRPADSHPKGCCCWVDCCNNCDIGWVDDGCSCTLPGSSYDKIMVPCDPPPTPPPSPFPSPATGASNSVENEAWFLAVVIMGSLLIAGMLLAGGIIVYRRRQGNLFGMVTPPGAGPDTTLLITDIQNSTHLWETLPVHVMDQSIKRHHGCIRHCATQQGGYESMTEGDSFILAFHTPHDAMKFSLECQVALLYVVWPPELLVHKEARPMWVAHIDALQQHAAQQHLQQQQPSPSEAATKSPGDSRRHRPPEMQWNPHWAGDEPRRQTFAASERDVGGMVSGGTVSLAGRRTPPAVSRESTLSRLKEDAILRSNSDEMDVPGGGVRGSGGAGGGFAAVSIQLDNGRIAYGDGNGHAALEPVDSWRSSRGRISVLRHTSEAALSDAADRGKGYDSGRSSLARNPYLSDTHTDGAEEEMSTHPTNSSTGSMTRVLSIIKQFSARGVRSLSRGREKTGHAVALSATVCDALRIPAVDTAQAVMDFYQPSPLSVRRGADDESPAHGPGHHLHHHPSGVPRSSMTRSNPDRMVSSRSSGTVPTPRHLNQLSSPSDRYDCASSILESPAVAGGADGGDGDAHGGFRQSGTPSGAQRDVLPAMLVGPMGADNGGDSSGDGMGGGVGGVSLRRRGAADSSDGGGGDGGPRGRSTTWPRASPGMRALPRGPEEGPGSGRGFPRSSVSGIVAMFTTPAPDAPREDHRLSPRARRRSCRMSRVYSSGRRCMSWAECVQALWLPVEPAALKSDVEEVEGAILIFRGLRVRIGIHTGIVEAEDVSVNRASGRIQYGGQALKRTRQVSDAARGGMVLCSGETFGRLPLRKFENKALVVYAGDHQMPETSSSASPCVALYQGVPAVIHPRLVYLEDVRSYSRLAKDTLSAPVGYATICFMYVVGAQAILNDLGTTGQEALELFRTECCRMLIQVDGYLVEAADGFLLTAFPHPVAAVLWALRCQQAMVAQPWPTKLLEHELAEEIFTYVAAPGASAFEHRSSARRRRNSTMRPPPSQPQQPPPPPPPMAVASPAVPPLSRSSSAAQRMTRMGSLSKRRGGGVLLGGQRSFRRTALRLARPASARRGSGNRRMQPPTSQEVVPLEDHLHVDEYGDPYTEPQRSVSCTMPSPSHPRRPAPLHISSTSLSHRLSSLGPPAAPPPGLDLPTIELSDFTNGEGGAAEEEEEEEEMSPLEEAFQGRPSEDVDAAISPSSTVCTNPAAYAATSASALNIARRGSAVWDEETILRNLSVAQFSGHLGRASLAPGPQTSTAARRKSSHMCSSSASFATDSSGQSIIKQVVCRGLRLKAGCDVGLVSPEVSATTGRMVYRGRVMNRAARIAAHATAGHVLTSKATWTCAQASHFVEAFGISATNTGTFNLKGVTELVELYECRLNDPTV